MFRITPHNHKEKVPILPDMPACDTLQPIYPLHLALYEPDMAPNVGNLMRLGACLGITMHVIEPCGFPFSKRALDRSLMDYGPHVTLLHHADWQHFTAWRQSAGGRLLLATTKGAVPYTDFCYQPDDILLLGSESKGAPDFVHAQADGRIYIPMRKGLRSINVSSAGAMITGEALRQITTKAHP